MHLENNSVDEKNKFQSDFDLYGNIFKEATNAIFIGDEKGNFIDVNVAAELLTGYSRIELLLMKMPNLFPQNVIKTNPLKYDEVLSGKVISARREIENKDGELITIDMKSKMLSNGKLISIFTDASVQVELQNSERKYKEIIENMKEALVILQDAKLKFANENTAKLLGYSLPEIIGKPFLDFVHPDDRQVISDNHLARLKGENISSSYDFRLFSKAGKVIWAETNPIIIEYEGKPAIQAFLIDTTEKRKLQASLEQSEYKFRNLVENMKEGIVSINLSSQILYASQGLAKIIGYSVDELAGKDFTRFIFEDDIPYSQRQFSKVLENKPETTEFRVVTKDGDIIWVRISGKPILKNGNVIGISAVIIDINSRKIAEDNLKNSEMKYRNLIDNSPIGIFIHQKGKVVYLNAALKKIAGYDDFSDFLNKSFFQFVPEEYHQGIKERTEYIIRTKGKSKLAETKIISQSGKFVDVLSLGQYVLFEGIPSVQSYIYDITEFNKYKTNVDTLTEAVSQSSSAIIIYNFVGVVEYANLAAEKLTGMNFDKNEGKRQNIFKILQIDKDSIAEISKTVFSGKEWAGEISITAQDSKIVELRVIVSPIFNNVGKITHFVSIAEDITAKKEIEKNLQIAKEHTEKSDKLKSDFLAQMSHEIRTPINAIVSFSGLLKDELLEILDEDQRISFELIEKAGERIIRTIELLLNYSELKTHSYQPAFHRIEIGPEIISKLSLEFRRQAKLKKLKFEVNIDTDDSFFYGDRHSLEQIFSNLIDNAIKYTDKGCVEVRLFKSEIGKLTVIIKDTGTGIAKDYLGDIFNPFSQEEAGYTRSFEGNGLGLALVKEYCEMNNIKIGVESTKNVGTTFTLVF